MENCNGSSGFLRRGTWTPAEDGLLRKCIENYGEGKWHLVPLRAGLNRCRKSCRLRWFNYLRPSIKRGHFSRDEVDLIIRLHKLLGNRWSLIAGRLPGRTANDVKNFWNTHIEKKLMPATGEASPATAKLQKAINKSNIARPRPRTFSNLQLLTEKLTLPIKIAHDENRENKQKNPSSSHEEADDSVRWWRDLLETTIMENEQEYQSSGPDMFAGGLNDGNIHGGFDANGFPDFCIDDNIWELLSSKIK